MKRIVSEDSVSAGTRGGLGGSKVPEAQIYLPNYREVIKK
jgi:hypothetical protein